MKKILFACAEATKRTRSNPEPAYAKGYGQASRHRERMRAASVKCLRNLANDRDTTKREEEVCEARAIIIMHSHQYLREATPIF